MQEHHNGPRMRALARSFPTLQQAEGLEPWNADTFARWLAGPGPAGSTATTQAGLFVLSVWNWDCIAHYNSRLKRSWSLNLVRAMGCWDDSHRAAFVAWARAPWSA